MPDATRASRWRSSFARLGRGGRAADDRIGRRGQRLARSWPMRRSGGAVRAERPGRGRRGGSARTALPKSSWRRTTRPSAQVGDRGPPAGVASELAPAEISDRLDRDEIEVQEILAAAFEKLRRLPVKETTCWAHSASRSSPRGPAPTSRRSSTASTGATASRSSAWPPTSPGRGRSSAPRDAGVETGVFARARTTATGPSATPRWPIGSAAREVDLIVLAGYMELLSAGVRAAVPEPDRERPPGAAARRSRASTRSGRRSSTASQVTGVTVHFVDEGVDSGPIILQRAIEVPYTRDRSQLEREIHEVEHRAASGGDPPDRRRCRPRRSPRIRDSFTSTTGGDGNG